MEAGSQVKVTIELNARQEARLVAIAETLDTSKADVIRRAVSLFHALVMEKEQDADTKVQIVNEDGNSAVTTREIVLF